MTFSFERGVQIEEALRSHYGITFKANQVSKQTYIVGN